MKKLKFMMNLLMAVLIILTCNTGIQAQTAGQPGKSNMIAWGEDIINAVNNLDFDKLYEIVKANPSLAKKRDKMGWSLLHIVAKEGRATLEQRLKLIQLLISKGADVNLKVSSSDKVFGGTTPLHFAASSDSYEVVRLLVKNGADVKARNGYGNTPLHSAAFYGNKPEAELFISKGANINAPGQDGKTPLFDAVQQGQQEIVSYLLQKGANVNAKDKHKFTPLHQAVLSNKKEIAIILINYGANVNARTSEGDTPLSYADPTGEDYELGFEPSPELIDLLIKHGAIK